MLELPISDYLKDYSKKNNVILTDSQKATIYWNSYLSESEKLAVLKEMYDSTEDEVLKKQIQARLDFVAKSEELFMKEDSDYVYLVVLDEDEATDCVFATLAPAISYGKENCEEDFRINKVILEEKVVRDSDDEQMLGGTAGFTKAGEMTFCTYYNSREIEFMIVGAEESTSFEDGYIPLLNPFEYGDIVRIKGDTRPAIVVTPNQQWYETMERMKNHMYLTYDSNTVTVEFLYPDGEFSHGHPNILWLEKVEEWENQQEWELLKAISNLMKGEGWIETVFARYQRNKFC